MKIYLVRHGEAVSPDIDPAKPLSPEGRKEVEKLAKFLAIHTPMLSSILYSQKLRAKQTAEIYGAFLAPEMKLEEHAHLAPNDSIQEILPRVREEDGCMVVGHLPFLGRLAGMLVTGDENREVVKFGAGQVVCLERVDGHFVIDWALGTNLVS